MDITEDKKEEIKKMLSEYERKISGLEKEGYEILKRHLEELDKKKVSELRNKLGLS